jgi:hypothetical protein
MWKREIPIQSRVKEVIDMSKLRMKRLTCLSLVFVLLGIFSAHSFAAEGMEYVEIVDSTTLEALTSLDERRARLVMAAWVGGTRLIDNMALN